MLTLGIDLSSEKAKTAACSLHWQGHTAEIECLALGLENADLLPLMHKARCVGVDAPFGWPDDFREAVAGWAADDHWTLRWPDRDQLKRLRLRCTDRWLEDMLKKTPLSVSSAGIAVTAWRAAALLTAFYEEHASPLDRIEGPVREAYPGAALLAWKLVKTKAQQKGDPHPEESYKTSRPAREALLDRMAPADGWLRLTADQRELLAAKDHRLDALLCALIARAAATGLTHLPPPDMDVGQVAREGWIAHPCDYSWASLPGRG